MNSYEAKLERRRERLEARAEKLRAEGQARLDSGFERLRAIPFGQPILIGHHSEKGDRSYRRKACNAIDKGFEMQKQAAEVAARAESVGTGGISSDDPEAVEKLKEKLAGLEAEQERMKLVNKVHAAFQKHGEKAFEKVELSEAEKNVIRTYVPPYSWEKHPYAPYQMQNNGANIRRIQERIQHLERNANRETKEVLHNSGVKLVENAEENRVQLFFPGKPAAEVRAKLKSFGFRWSPMAGAWQRHLNGNGVWAAKSILESLTPAE